MFKLKVETDGASILDVSDLVRQLNHDQDVTIMQKRINNPDGTHKEKTYRYAIKTYQSRTLRRI